MLQSPPTRTDDTVETLHGVEVPDPYRWLEDLDGDETVAWTKAQTAATQRWLAENTTDRQAIRARLDQLSDFTRWAPPSKHGNHWFFMRHDAGADQPVLVVADSPEGDGRVLIDPREFSGDGAATSALSGFSPSPDGSLIAYGIAESGSDWNTWRVRDVASGNDRDDLVEWSKYGGPAWLKSSDAFVYPALDKPSDDATYSGLSNRLRLQLHRLGTPQIEDEVWHQEDADDLLSFGSISDDGRWLIVYVSRGTRRENLLRVYDLESPNRTMIDLFPEPEHANTPVGNVGSTMFLLTDEHAAKQRVVAMDVLDPGDRREIVAERDDQLLAAMLAGGRLVCHWLRDAASKLTVHDLDGTELRQVDLPEGTAIQGTAGVNPISLTGGAAEEWIGIACTGFTDPGSVWIHNVVSGETRIAHETSGLLDSSKFVVSRAAAPSADGTAVPLFLLRRSDISPTGDVPVLLYGYGGFDIPITPVFNSQWLTWVERGGLLAVTNLRGGGEFGKDWYDAGRRERKQNVFDDMAGCARWLASSGWSRPGRIALTGRSNGGLLSGACLTQHPELYGAVVPQVGVLDMYRFHKFTGGWMWTSDYGDPDIAEEWEWQRGYSPLHNVMSGTIYPPTLITTGDHDDRVVPAHSYKFAAALQSAQGGPAPILLQVDVAAGHGSGKPLSALLDERADVLAFIEAALK